MVKMVYGAMPLSDAFILRRLKRIMQILLCDLTGFVCRQSKRKA